MAKKKTAAKKPAKKAPAKKTAKPSPFIKAPAKKAAVKKRKKPLTVQNYGNMPANDPPGPLPTGKRKQDNSLVGQSGLGGMTPAVHDFAQAFRALVSPPAKRSAASLLGDDPTPFNGLALRELVNVFISDNARLGELTAAAKQAGCNPQAFSIAAVLALPYMRETKAAVELYLKVLSDG